MVTKELERLSDAELSETIGAYPWFGAARMERFRRLSSRGGDPTGAQAAEDALYVVDRRKLYDLMHVKAVTVGEIEVKDLVTTAIKPEEKERGRVAGADYFSSEDYASVKGGDDPVFSKPPKTASQEDAPEAGDEGQLSDFFCTETMAEIYAEQGYPEEAKHIYSRLLLVYPEKSAYFASLIEKLK